MSRRLSLAETLPPPPQDALPYGRHSIDEADIAAVTAVLRAERLAHGPKVGEFERALAATVGAEGGAACSSGTAALHLALASLDVGEGDLCLVPAITFLATASAARFCGAELAFTDVDADTGLMTPQTLDAALSRAGRPVRAVLPVHLGGRSCAMAPIAELARGAGAVVVEDACHALGGIDLDGHPIGSCAHSDAAAFSFHPVKTIAAGEGGMVVANDRSRIERIRRLANHGVSREPALLSDQALSFDENDHVNPWSYEQIELGYNYRMNEMEAALGLSQLSRLPLFVRRRRCLSSLYDLVLEPFGRWVRPVRGQPGERVSPHLYQVLIDFDGLGIGRAEVMRALAAEGIGTQVHYIPLYRQPYFRRRYGELRLEGAEAFYRRVLALPLFPSMHNHDVERVASALARVLGLSATS